MENKTPTPTPAMKLKTLIDADFKGSVVAFGAYVGTHRSTIYNILNKGQIPRARLKTKLQKLGIFF